MLEISYFSISGYCRDKSSTSGTALYSGSLYKTYRASSIELLRSAAASKESAGASGNSVFKIQLKDLRFS